MIRQRGKKAEETKKPKRRQLGILFNEDLWYELRKLALSKRQSGTRLMEQAVREFLERQGNHVIPNN